MSIEQIQSLELKLESPLDLEIDRSKSLADGSEAAVVNGSALVAFGPDIELQTQQDILYSMQIAAGAANGKADRETDIAGWYTEYVRVLELTGWVVRNWSPSRRKTSEAEVDLAEVALDLLALAITGPALAVMKAAVTAMREMADDDGMIRLFEHYGANDRIGNFQFGAVERGAGKELNLGVAAYQFTLRERRKKIIFVKWHEKQVELWGGATSATFNEAAYAKVRQVVESKLDSDRLKAFAALELSL